MPTTSRASAGTTTLNRTSGLQSRGGQFTEHQHLQPEPSVQDQFSAHQTSLADARALAVRLMAAHNISDWKFEFDRAKSRIGQTNYQKRTITMGAVYAQAADTESITQTMLHEIAHVHAGPGHGHGPVWKRAGRAIGHTGGRTAVNPYSTQRDAAALMAAEFAAQSVHHVTSGPLLPGERVESLTGKFTGLLVSVARVNATIFCDQTGDQVLIRYSSLRRPSGAASASAPAAVKPAEKMRVGDRLYTISGRRGNITKVGRSRYHFTDDDGVMWSAPFSSCALVR